MSDFGDPVAQNVDVSPQKSLETIGSLIGLQQKRQALAGQAADVQMKQQDASQRAAMSQIDWSKHTGDDGTLDVASFSKDPAIRKAAGDYYPDVLAKAAQVKTAQVGAKQSLLTLNKDQLGAWQQTVGALKTDPDVVADNAAGRQKVANAYQSYGQTYGQDAARAVAPYQGPLTQAPQGKLASVLDHVQMQSVDAGKQMEMQAPTTGTVTTGPNIQPMSVASRYGEHPGAMTPQGPPIKLGLAPTEQVGYKEAASAASAKGSSRAAGVAGSDIDRSNQVSSNVKSAQAGIQTTQQIDDLADQIHSGKYAAWVSKAAAAAGFKEDTYARQLLEKDLGIVKTQLTSAAPSDSRAATILSGTPDATSDPQTIHGAMDYVRGSFRQNQAQGKNLSAYSTKHPDLSGFQHADDAFTSTAGPLVHEFLSLKEPDQRKAFYRRNFSNAQEAKKFRDQVHGSAHVLGLDDANTQ